MTSTHQSTTAGGTSLATRPAGFSDHVKVRTGDLADPAIAMKAVSERPDVIFHLAGVVSGEAEVNLEKEQSRAAIEVSMMDGLRKIALAPRCGNRTRQTEPQ